ncbi:MAG: MFS transporter [Actinomycetota bacterium]|nr:MFS transporter [Actinomycetota bacterium]
MASPRSSTIGRALPGLLLAMLLGALDQTIITPALPAVAADLGGLDRVPSVVTAYLAAATVVMPVYGKLGDRFGRTRVLLVAIGVFLAGAVCCAVAGTMTALIAGRALQGLGGGGLMVGPQAVIGELVSPRERGRYLGLIGAAYVVAAVGGPVVGGLLVEGPGWRSIFVLYPPLGVAAFVVLAGTLRLPRPSARAPIDYAGAVTLAAAVLGLVLLGQTGNPWWLALALPGALAWSATTRRAADPILPPRLFRDRAFAIPVAVSFLVGFALFGTLSYLPTYLQVALGVPPTAAGLVVTALMAGVLTTTVVSGRLITRTGRYKGYPVAGTALAAGGLGLLAVLGPVAGPAGIAAVMAVTGLGVGLVLQVMVLAAQNAVAHADLGTATSSVTFLRQIGASIGVAVAGALITARLTDGVPQATALAGAVPVVFAVMAPLLLLGCGLAVALPHRPLRTTAHVTEPHATEQKP